MKKLTLDYPTAWMIARSVPMKEHHERCSFAQTDGGCLCDCDVINKFTRKSFLKLPILTRRNILKMQSDEWVVNHPEWKPLFDI